MIEIDPTEGRKNTRLPSSSQYHEVKGLEKRTGADILVHPFKKLPDKLLDIPPHERALKRCCEGGFLIQRKSGGDFLHSIGDLAEIEHRMLQWSGNPWLLITGIKRTAKGSVTVKGSHHSFRSWKWNGIQAAMDTWKCRGGSVTRLDEDRLISDWLLWCEKTCREWLKTPVKKVTHKAEWKEKKVPDRKPFDKTPLQKIERVEPNWANTGRAWPPGIGEELLANLAKYVVNRWKLPPTLANCISLACSAEVTKVRLWGRKRQLDIRAWWGVNKSIKPSQLGVKSSVWMYHDEGKEGRIEAIEMVLKDEIITVNGKVYTTEEMCLGTVQNPIQIPEGGFIIEGSK